MLNLKQIRAKKSAGINLPDFDILLATATGQPREYLYAHPEFTPGFWSRIKLAYFLRRFRHSWPIAYIIGRKEFFGLDFLVNKHTLIPRPETELIVSLTLDRLQTTDYGLRPTVLIDIGTGSGCVPIAILKKQKHINITAVAVDISRGALRMAKKNAKKHGVNIKFLRGDLLEPIIKTLKQKNIKTILIAANLPYLTEAQFKSELSIQYEPYSALVADNKNGLSLYEKLFKQITRLLVIGHWSLVIFVEIDPRQASAALELAKKYFPDAKIEIKKDLAGRDRVVVTSFNSSYK